MTNSLAKFVYILNYHINIKFFLSCVKMNLCGSEFVLIIMSAATDKVQFIRSPYIPLIKDKEFEINTRRKFINKLTNNNFDHV